MHGLILKNFKVKKKTNNFDLKAFLRIVILYRASHSDDSTENKHNL